MRVCAAPETYDNSESNAHFHNEVLSQNVHLCLYWVEHREFLAISWYGKPEYNADEGVWRWGPIYFGDLFPGDKAALKHSWSVGKEGEVRLAAFVKIDK